MLKPTEDAIEHARTALAAASSAPDLTVRGIYLAIARNCVTAAAEQLRELELVLVARERELAHSAGSKQTTLPVAGRGSM